MSNKFRKRQFLKIVYKYNLNYDLWDIEGKTIIISYE